MRTVLGLLKPDRGSVWRSCALRIGYMPQKLHVDPTLPLSVCGTMIGEPALLRTTMVVCWPWGTMARTTWMPGAGMAMGRGLGVHVRTLSAMRG